MPRNQEPKGQIGSIMVADYGDAHQAMLNAKEPDVANYALPQRREKQRFREVT
jgi:hypothetical protein